MKKKFLLSGILFICILFSLSTSVFATGFSNIVSFGDSISDNGSNLFSDLLNDYGLDPNPTATDPYGLMHVTDGLVWVENLADTMGSTLYDVAYAGASSGLYNPVVTQYSDIIDDIIAVYPQYAGIAAQLPNTGLLSQVSLLTDPQNDYYDPYLNSLNMDDTLFTVWAGANDFLYPDDPNPIENAVENIGSALSMLESSGAKNILVPNLPDIGLTPEFYYGDSALSDAASQWTSSFNNELWMTLCEFSSANSDIDLYFFDVYSLFQEFVPGTEEWSDQFWFDGFHPSASGHMVLAEGAYGVLQSEPVPEPSTMLLFGSGLIGLAAFRRKFRKR